MEKKREEKEKEGIQMDVRRIQGQLEQLAQSASKLADKLDSSEGRSLRMEEKDLIRMAGMGVIREMGYFYLAGYTADFESSFGYLRETLAL